MEVGDLRAGMEAPILSPIPDTTRIKQKTSNAVVAGSELQSSAGYNACDQTVIGEGGGGPVWGPLLPILEALNLSSQSLFSELHVQQ